MDRKSLITVLGWRWRRSLWWSSIKTWPRTHSLDVPMIPPDREHGHGPARTSTLIASAAHGYGTEAVPPAAKQECFRSHAIPRDTPQW